MNQGTIGLALGLVVGWLLAGGLAPALEPRERDEAQAGRYVLGAQGLMILDTVSGTRYVTTGERTVAISVTGQRWTPSDPETEATVEEMRAVILDAKAVR